MSLLHTEERILLTVPLADMSGRTPPWLVDLISSYEDKFRVRGSLEGRKQKASLEAGTRHC